MKQEEVRNLYDRDFAAAYDDRFLLADFTKPNTDFEHRLIGELLEQKGGPWLDIGCGTGWFLSQFQDAGRGGLDLSPAMLELARQRNPGVEFRQGDFRLPIPEWRHKWSLVSCMWSPYCYLDTFGEVEAGVLNMVEWTAPGGSVLIPLIDLPDLRNYDVLYRTDTPFMGKILLNGVIWSWTDGDKLHKHLLAPHAAEFIEWLAPHFDDIRVVHYPSVGEGIVPRKAVLATGRRANADPAAPARIDWPEPHHVPRVDWTAAASPPASDMSELPFEAVAREMLGRLRPRRLIRGLRRRLGKSGR